MPQHNVLWVWHTSTFYLIRIHTVHTAVHTRARSCQHSNAYIEGISLESVPCGFGSIALRCCPSTLLHMTTIVYVSKIFVEIIHEWLKICEIHKIKDPQKFSIIW